MDGHGRRWPGGGRRVGGSAPSQRMKESEPALWRTGISRGSSGGGDGREEGGRRR